MYIDEFQNFATESFAVILSEARKYGLSLIMAHQTLAQIPDELRSLILGNAGLQVFFRINRQDAALLAKESFTYSGYEVKAYRSLNPVYWSLGEEWEKKTEELQTLQPRFCYVKHKVRGGLILIQTAEIEDIWVAAAMEEDEFEEHLRNLPIGRNYLRSRANLFETAKERQRTLSDEVSQVEEERRREHAEDRPPKREAVVKEKVLPPSEVKEATRTPIIEKADIAEPETQHRYLQNLVKRTAQDNGYRATVEASTPDGTGRVDVLLEKGGETIACEISVTTDERHELENIRKCLLAGYGEIAVCANERKKIEKIKELASKDLDPDAQSRILFFTPEELILYIEEKSAAESFKEETMKGYKVKVEYGAVGKPEKEKKQEAVAGGPLSLF
ncbi:MAG: type IV secretory system conjugative DNA transfer family protein, partial [Bacteroidetes bacterium]|nr:type IV secretory system conjugative DNA transfer family protein [Bacteroidota bacterium]